MAKPRCLCTGRTDIRCDAEHCDLAASPETAQRHQCVICYQYLYSEPHRKLWSGEGTVPALPTILSVPSQPQVTKPTIIADVKKEPGVVRKAVNLIRATAQHLSTGLVLVDQAEADRRLAICRDCPDFIDNSRCRRCGCKMTIKAAWKEQKCPIGKW